MNESPWTAELAQQYERIPWRYAGDTREGCDCLGLVKLYLREQCGFTASIPESTPKLDQAAESILSKRLAEGFAPARSFTKGDVLFFRDRITKKIRHVGVAVNESQILHTNKDSGSCVVSLNLILRGGLRLAGVINSREANDLATALADSQAGWNFVIATLISVALSVASSFLMNKPKLPQLRAQDGRYGFDQLFTQTNPQIPLPDLLGGIAVAGNSPYQSLIDKAFSGIEIGVDPTQQKVNRVIILGSGPIEGNSYNSAVIKINGTPYNDTTWHPGGIVLNPAQTKAAAVDGLIGSYSAEPSLTFYDGAWAKAVPVDIRASYDRNFPIYGFNGCSYVVLRLIDSTKFSQLNLTATVKGRKCRTYTVDGFDQTTITSEAVGTGDGVTTRFKLAHDDIVADSETVTVGGSPYAAMTRSANTGDVYTVNKLKGYIQFGTAPAAGAAVVVTYTYYPRQWTQCPADLLVYLLTENIRGKGLPEDAIDWDAAVALQTYCNEQITWTNASGTFTEPRYTANYSIDVRKPIQDHIRALLDACYSCLFLSNGLFVMKARGVGSTEYAFNADKILAGTFSSEMIDRSQRANRVNVYYHSKDTYNAETAIHRDDQDDQDSRVETAGNRGVTEETLHMLAVDSETQAERLAEQILRENVGTRWVGEFKTNIKGLALEPMDVISLTHPSQPSWSAKLVRIEDITQDDHDIFTIKWSEYLASAYI